MVLLRKGTERAGTMRIINMNVLWILWCSNNYEVLKIKVNTPILLTEELVHIKNPKWREGSFKNEGMQAERNWELRQVVEWLSLRPNLRWDFEQVISFPGPPFPNL